MTRQHGTDAAGQPLNLIGGVIHQGSGSVPGLVITTPEESTMPKAPRDGKYTLNGARFRIRCGDPLPAGAVMDADPEERAQPKAPENKAAKAAPENRAAGKKAE